MSSIRIFSDAQLDRLIREATQTNIPPANWDKGWFYPWQIAGGGKEIPYQEGGKWKLRIFNAKERKYYIHDFATDMLEPERE